jgi:TolB protein
MMKSLYISVVVLGLSYLANNSAAADASDELAGHEFLITSTRTGNTEIFRVDPVTGDMTNVTRSPNSEERYPCWSPDGSRFAFTSDRDGTANLYVANIDGSHVLQLTHLKAPAVAYMPSWTGRRIVFGLHAERPEMVSIDEGGSDLKVLGVGHDPCISPDGRQIAYTGECPGGVSVFLMDADGSSKRQLVKEPNPWGAAFPCWSPDSRKIAFAAKAGEGLEIFTVNAGGTDERQLTHLGQISTPPAWSPDGKWISFRSTDERYWSDPARMKKIYGEHPGDKRPVWVMAAEGSNPHIVEPLRYGCAMDGSRAQWRPLRDERKSK